MNIKERGDSFRERSKKVHNNKYEYYDDYVNNKTKIDIKCPVHGIFKQRPDSHLRGVECPKCNGNNVKKTNAEFIRESIEIHGELFIYDNINYKNNITPVKIKCPVHGIFKQKPLVHLRGFGCPSCSNNKKKNNEIFIQESINKYGDIFDYSMTDYKGTKIPVKIKCKNHNFIFEQMPYNHLRGEVTCTYCSDLKMNHDKFVEKSNIIHNNKYEYPEKYKNARTKILIICPDHKEFIQNPNDHLSGHGCPKCNMSNGEREIIKILEEKMITYIYQSKVDKYFYDFYLPDYNLYIEYDGRQHFEPVSHFGGDKAFKKIVRRDKIKNKLVNNIIRISYKDSIEQVINQINIQHHDI